MPRQRTLRVLGIETSCDETAAAVVIVSRQPQADSRKPSFAFDVRSSVVASQVAIHAKYGGVVPEVAAREHVTAIMPTVEQALIGVAEAFRPPRTRITGGNLKVSATDHGIDAIAVTAGPGLITSLSVGVETARTLAYAWGKPLVAVNHIEGHVLSALLPPDGTVLRQRNPKSKTLNPKQFQNSNVLNPKLVFPALALIVSGGHTELLLMRGWGRYECIGATRDDAAGEAFDKVGKLLGLSYPGGPAVARAADGGNPRAFDFPRPMLGTQGAFSAKGGPASGGDFPRGMLHSKDYEFSFSGLKTAVRYTLEGLHARCLPPHTPPPTGKGGNNKSFLPFRVRGGARGGGALTSDLCASFQAAAVDVLVAKTVAAAQRYGVKTILLGGGVAANVELRRQLTLAVRNRLAACSLQLAASAYTGDNAAMIAAAGGVRLLLGEQTPWERLDVDANWELGRSPP